MEGSKSRKDPSKIRCRHWPSCKTADCPYVHPKEQCPKFPACWFGDNCLYIHPSIACKFGHFCTRPNCSYKHPGMMSAFGNGGLRGRRGGRGMGFRGRGWMRGRGRGRGNGNARRNADNGNQNVTENVEVVNMDSVTNRPQAEPVAEAPQPVPNA